MFQGTLMIMKRFLSVSAAMISLAGVAAPSAHAAQVSTVSGATAAAKLRDGMASYENGAWSRTALTKLAVKPSGSMTGYNRDLFPHWRDASTWGWSKYPNDKCDSRAAALYRDGTNVKMSASCTNLTGTWIDPYSGKVFNAASDIDIDHIVPLGNVWASGGANWSTTTKTAYANDPLVLVSSWDRLNQAKGDRSPDQWKPTNTASYCNYAERWVAVKTKYKLNVTTAERTALTNMLNGCK